MRRIKTGLIFGVCLWLMSVPAISGAQEIEPSIEPQADNILRQMSAYVGGFQHFTIHVENSVDTLLPCSQKLQLSRAVDMFVKRPNRFRANIDGDVVDQELYYDGTSITLYSKDVNVYASLAVPPTIDAAMDYAIESFGLVAPMVDLIYKDAYEILIEDVQSGSYVGLSKVFGVECHHLAFRGAETGWQIWIENSKTPLPRKIVITSRWVAGAPQFTAFLNDWDASTPIKEGLFTFKAPETAERIEFLPAAK